MAELDAEKKIRFWISPRFFSASSASCMLKPDSSYRTSCSRRARVATSGARSHAGTTAGPRPIASGSLSTVAERGPSWRCVASPEQPTELRHTPTLLRQAPARSHGRSHSQGRAIVTSASTAELFELFVGIDVAKDQLDLARSDVQGVLTVANDAAGIAQIVATLKAVAVKLIVVEATGGLGFGALVDRVTNACRWPGSTPATCVTSPSVSASLPRPIRSTPACCVSSCASRQTRSRGPRTRNVGSTESRQKHLTAF